MFRHVPNALTALRLALAVVFFVMLSYYQYDQRGLHGELLWLNIAFIVYLVALFTDFLDGYLARLWKVEGVFGRIVDPFVDKVLVLGSFIFFAGKNFTIPQFNPQETPTNVMTITGIVPWMVVVILGRELLVTSLRGSSESSGVNFAAVFSGKLKMTLQSITILVVLVYVNYRPMMSHHVDQIAMGIRDAFIWLTIFVTVISGISYVRRGVALYRNVKEAH
ncbi:MAG TPA: CDP-alcohol phosphatidyltransferase family protein [Tepidisphaeraceae bacterium]|nr:CDP-alcohol phosphatidyltransferase family protein [Tepidisphaeraceae bacterium]